MSLAKLAFVLIWLIAATVGYVRLRIPGDDIEVEWIENMLVVPDAVLHSANITMDEPVYQTLDLQYFYLITRVKLSIQQGDVGIKQYDVLSSIDGTHYDRIASVDMFTGDQLDDIRDFPPVQARYVQVVLNTWYGGDVPKIEEIKVGATFPIYRTIRLVDSNCAVPSAYAREHLIDRSLDASSKWAPDPEDMPTEGIPVVLVFDLGHPQSVTGTIFTTDGPKFNVRQYDLLGAIKRQDFRKIGASEILPDDTVSDTLTFGPLNLRYLRVSINEWYDDYPEAREFKVIQSRPSEDQPFQPEQCEMAFYDDCGKAAWEPNLVQGFDHRKDHDPHRDFVYHWDTVNLSYLDVPSQERYWAEIVYFQQENEQRIQRLDVDGLVLHGERALPQGAVEQLVFPLPRQVYEDGQFELHFRRVSGPNAVVSEVTIWRQKQLDTGDSM